MTNGIDGNLGTGEQITIDADFVDPNLTTGGVGTDGTSGIEEDAVAFVPGGEVFSINGQVYTLLSDGTVRQGARVLSDAAAKEVVKRGFFSGALKWTAVKLTLGATFGAFILGVFGKNTAERDEQLIRTEIYQDIARDYEAQGYEVTTGSLGPFDSGGILNPGGTAVAMIGVTEIRKDGVLLYSWNPETKAFDANPGLLTGAEETPPIEVLTQRAQEIETYENTPVGESTVFPETEDQAEMVATPTNGGWRFAQAGDTLDISLDPLGRLTFDSATQEDGGTEYLTTTAVQTSLGTEYDAGDGFTITVLHDADGNYLDGAGNPSDEPIIQIEGPEDEEFYKANLSLDDFTRWANGQPPREEETDPDTDTGNANPPNVPPNDNVTTGGGDDDDPDDDRDDQSPGEITPSEDGQINPFEPPAQATGFLQRVLGSKVVKTTKTVLATLGGITIITNAETVLDTVKYAPLIRDEGWAPFWDRVMKESKDQQAGIANRSSGSEFQRFLTGNTIVTANESFSGNILAAATSQEAALANAELTDVPYGQGFGADSYGALVQNYESFRTVTANGVAAMDVYKSDVMTHLDLYGTNLPATLRGPLIGLTPDEQVQLEAGTLDRERIVTALNATVEQFNADLEQNAKPNLIVGHYLIESGLVADGTKIRDLVPIMNALARGDEQPFRDYFDARVAEWNQRNPNDQITITLPGEGELVTFPEDGKGIEFGVDKITDLNTGSAYAFETDTVDFDVIGFEPDAGLNASLLLQVEDGDPVEFAWVPGGVALYAPGTVIGQAGDPDLRIVPTDEILEGPFLTGQSQLSQSAQNADAIYDGLLAQTDEDGNPVYTPEEASEIAAEVFRSEIEGEAGGLAAGSELTFTNVAYRNGFIQSTLEQAPETLDLPTYETVSDALYDTGVRALGVLIDPEATAEAKAEAAETLSETFGIEVVDGRVTGEMFDIVAEGSAVQGRDTALEVQAALDALPEDASEADRNAAIADVISPELAEVLPDEISDEEARAEVYAQLDTAIADAQEAGNVAAVFLLTGVRNFISMNDNGDLDGAFFSDLLRGNGAAFSTLLGRIGDGELAAYGDLLPGIADAIDSAGVQITDESIAVLSSGVVLGRGLKQYGQLNGDDVVFGLGVALEAGFSSLVEVSRGSVREVPVLDDQGVQVVDPETGQPQYDTVEVDLTFAVGDIIVDAGADLLTYFGDKYGEDYLTQIGTGAELGWEVFKIFNGRGDFTDTTGALGAFAASFFDDESTSGKIIEGFALGTEVVSLFTSKGSSYEYLSKIGLGDLGATLSNSKFYATGSYITAAISLIVDILDYAGVDVPPEVSWAATTAASAFAGPVGWAFIVIDTISRLFSMRSWTDVQPFWQDIDADGDYLMDDDSFIATEFSSNFFGRVSVKDGEIRYEVNGVNPQLLETATFDLRTDDVVDLDVVYDEEDGQRATLEVNGTTYRGTIETGSGQVVNQRGYVRSGRDSDKITEAYFVSEDGDIRLPVDVTEHGSDDYDNAYGVVFRLSDGALDDFPPYWRIDISGVYGELNPVTPGEDFDTTIILSEEEYNAVLAELGTDGAIDLTGDDARLLDADNPLTPDVVEGTMLSEVMSRIQVTFESNERDPNVFQYIDVNRDGILDLVRYGIEQDDDGLHSGDEMFEVTLLNADGTPMGLRDENGSTIDAEGFAYNALPTIRGNSMEEVMEIGSLTPYLFRWAAARPELGLTGRDPASIYGAVQEAGQLDEMEELRDLDYESAREMGLVIDETFTADGELSAEQIEAHSAVLDGVEADMIRGGELAAELGLFNTSAYAGTNDDMARFNGNGMELSWHYMAHGNAEGREIDGSGTVLETGTEPAWAGLIYRGPNLEPGQRLLKNEMLLSENGQFATVFWENGRLVTYDLSGEEPVAIWEADRDGNTDDGWVEVGANGELMIRDDDGDVEFDSGTATDNGHGNYELKLGNDGNLNLYDRMEGRLLWGGGPGEWDNDGYGRFVGTAGTADLAPDADRAGGTDLDDLGTQFGAGTLTAGQALVSDNGAFALELTEDGTVRLVDNAAGTYRLLSNETTDLGADATLVLSEDGGMEVLDGTGEAVWAAGTAGDDVDRAFFLRIHDDGGVALVDSQFNRPLWTFGSDDAVAAAPEVEVLGSSLAATAEAGATMERNQALVSADGRQILLLDDDGRLIQRDIVSQEQTVLAEGGDTLRMQRNGNLVLRDADDGAVWTSNTGWSGEGGDVLRPFTLEMGDDGDPTIVDSEYGQPVWSMEAGVIDAPQPVDTVLGASQTGGLIEPGQALLSENGRFLMELDLNGRWLVRDLETDAVTVLGEAGRDAELDLQDDGHLVLYGDGRDEVEFASDTYSEAGDLGRQFRLTITDDGVVVFDDPANRETLWTSTDGRQRDARDYVIPEGADGPPDDVDWLEYIASYGDLMDAFGADPTAGRLHYKSSGMDEDRVIAFDAERYLQANPDLVDAFGDDLDAATRHYIQTGRNEDRPGVTSG